MNKRVDFAIPTAGIGNPDYFQTVQSPATMARALVVSFPEIQTAAQRFDDFAKIEFSSVQTSYVVGTNANANLNGSWQAGQLARDVQFYATANCWVRFNTPASIPQFIPANLPLRFSRRVALFYVYADTSSGTLYAWIEG